MVWGADWTGDRVAERLMPASPPVRLGRRGQTIKLTMIFLAVLLKITDPVSDVSAAPRNADGALDLPWMRSRLSTT
jgi:hypothetical protein